MTLAPIGIIAALARTKGFLDEDKLMDSKNQVKKAWTFSSNDRRFRFTSSILPYGHVLTEIFDKGRPVFSAHNYTIRTSAFCETKEIETALTDKFTDVDLERLLNDFSQTAHFALTEFNTLSRPHTSWECIEESGPEQIFNFGSIEITKGLSVINTPFIHIAHAGVKIGSFDFINNDAKPDLSDQYKEDFIFTLFNILKK